MEAALAADWITILFFPALFGRASGQTIVKISDFEECVLFLPWVLSESPPSRTPSQMVEIIEYRRGAAMNRDLQAGLMWVHGDG